MAVSVGAKPARAKATPVSRERFVPRAMAEPGRAPSHTSATRRRRCGGHRRDRRARAGLEIDTSEPQARVWRSRGRPGPTAPRTPAAPQATSSTANSGCTAGVEGAGRTGEPGCSARGRQQGLAAVPVGGGRARAGLEIDHSEPQARVWRSRGRAAAHRHTQRPVPTKQPGPTAGTSGARNTSGATSSTRPLRGIAKGAGISRPLARVPSLIHEGHLDAAH